MRLTLALLLIHHVISFGQKMKWNHDEIKWKVHSIQGNAIISDSLEYTDSTCTYFKKAVPYSGYIIHSLDNQYRFNLFQEGKYFGEEWIFDMTSIPWDSDSLVNRLKEFRVRSDTNGNFMVVTTYHDFESNSIHEIYVDHRYKCALRKIPKDEAFDIIFGGVDLHKLPYRSFYKNGNKKEISEGIPYTDGKRLTYYENGKKESVYNIKKNGENGLLKKFEDDGRCTKRIKFRNNKIIGIYVIMGGKFGLSIVARHRLKKQTKRKE